MAVTLKDEVVQDLEELVEKRISDIPSDKLLAIALGDITDGEFEVMTRFRQALRDAGNGNGNGNGRRARRPRPDTTTGRSIAVGRHAYDYLAAREWDDDAKAALREATPRRTLVGLHLPSEDVARQYADVLRSGAVESRTAGDELTASRLEKTAERLLAA